MYIIRCILKTHINLEYPELIQINEPTGRLYEVPSGNKYPSVTTVLGHASDKTWLVEWRNRVGEEEADRVSKRATLRGTALHKYCEDYLNNLEVKVNLFDQEAFNQFKQALNEIDNIYAIEKALFSNKLRTAGTVDLIAEFDGKLSIIDWKTSKSIKYRDDIHSYFMQCSFYAWCMREMFNINIEQVVIVMAVDGNNKPLIFKETVSEWLPKFAEVRKQFKLIKGH